MFNLRISAFIICCYVSQWTFCIDDCLPSLDGICGLTAQQVAAAQRRSDCSASCVHSQLCSSDDCIGKQETLVDCLVGQEVSVRQLEQHFGQAVLKLMKDLAKVTDAKERATSVLFDQMNQLNEHLGRYYRDVVVVESTSKAHTDARRLMRERMACFKDIQRKLCRTKASLDHQLRLDALKRINEANRFGVSVAACDCTDCPANTRPPCG